MDLLGVSIVVLPVPGPGVGSHSDSYFWITLSWFAPGIYELEVKTQQSRILIFAFDVLCDVISYRTFF
jgi:hypothetical protein